MAEKSVSKTWSSNYLFLLASIGSTVGLSNIWRFTYLAGENGGGAFVLVYVISLIVMGIPILAAELMIGRRGGKSMVGTFRVLVEKEGMSAAWKYFGWVSMVGVFLILSFYCVIAGMTIDSSTGPRVAPSGSRWRGASAGRVITRWQFRRASRRWNRTRLPSRCGPRASPGL